MDQAVKQRPDATSCLVCGGPTWSSDGYCFRCRRERDLPPPVEPQSAPAEPIELPSEPRLDGAGRIAEEIPCRACGYLLQGLEPSGVCPECSSPIDRSIHGDLLRFCDPAWLRRIASGLLVIVLGFVAWMLFAIVFSAVAYSVGAIGSGANASTVTVGLGAGGIGVTAIIVLGVWWLTTPDPGQGGHAGRAGDEPPISARKLARWFVLAQLVAAPLQLFGQTVTGASPLNPMAATTAGALISAGLGMVLGTVAQVGYVAGLLYLRKLARRIPRDGLGGQLNLVAWGYGSTQCLGLLYGIGVLLVMPSFMAGGGTAGRPMGMFTFIAVGGCTVGLGSLVFSIWALVLVIMSRSAITKVAEAAGMAWDRAGGESAVTDGAA